MIEVAPDRLTGLSARIFEAAGTPGDIAEHVARHLVGANLAGHDSHGVIRVPWYVDHIRQGWVRPAARPVLTPPDGARASVSGEWGFGHPAAALAMEVACELAGRHGVGVVALTRATHLGRLGTYVEAAADRGRVGLMWLGGLSSARAAVPYGGVEPVYGTNPIAAAFPAGEAGPLMIDFATTQMAGGKLMVALDRGTPLEPGSLLDREGRPTTDPKAFFEGGALLPFGGHKGYGLAFFAQLLGQVLTGADQTADGGGDIFKRSGTLVLALDPGLFRPAEEAAAVAADFAERVRGVRPTSGVDRVRAPGDPEREARAARASAIPLPETTWSHLLETAAELGVDPAPYAGAARAES